MSTPLEIQEAELPPFWKAVRLGEAVESIDYGMSAPIPKQPPADGIKIVSTADITRNGQLLYDQVRRIKAPNKTISRLALKGGDVLFNWRNSLELIGKTAVFEQQPEPHIFASFLLRIRCDEVRAHNNFLSYLMNHWRDKQVFVKLARRAVNQANYNRNEISTLMIPLPPYLEQRKIAWVLGLVQRAMQQQEQLLALTIELKKGLLHQLFTGGLRHETQKQTELGPIPQSWELVEIGSLGKVITGSTPKTKVPEYYSPAEIDFIAPADLGQIRDVYNSTKKISRTGLDTIRPLPANAVMCVCIGSSIGKVGMTVKSESATNQQINSIICDATHNPHFIYYLLSHYAAYWRRFATFGPVPILSKGTFENIKIAIPATKGEEEEIAKCFRALDSKSEVYMRKKAALNALFRTLLHELMTGRIRVLDLKITSDA